MSLRQTTLRQQVQDLYDRHTGWFEIVSVFPPFLVGWQCSAWLFVPVLLAAILLNIELHRAKKTPTPAEELANWQRYAAYLRSCAFSGECNPDEFDRFQERYRRDVKQAAAVLRDEAGQSSQADELVKLLDEAKAKG